MHPFEYQKPTERQLDTLSKFRQQYRELCDAISTSYPPGRYRSLALTALEESNLWLNKASVFELYVEKTPEQLAAEEARKRNG